MHWGLGFSFFPGCAPYLVLFNDRSLTNYSGANFTDRCRCWHHCVAAAAVIAALMGGGVAVCRAAFHYKISGPLQEMKWNGIRTCCVIQQKLANVHHCCRMRAEKNQFSLRPQHADTEPPRRVFNSLVKHRHQLDWCALSNTPKKNSAAKRWNTGNNF